MRILFIVPSFSRTGPTIFTWNLIQGLMELSSEDKLEIEVRAIQRTDTCRPKWFTGEMTSGIMPPSKHTDIIHSTMFRADVTTAFWPKNCPRVIGVHNFLSEDLRLQYSAARAVLEEKLWLYCMQFRESTMVVSSPFMQKYYSSKLAKGSFKVIPYGIPDSHAESIDPEDISALEALRDRGYLIAGSVGGLITRKGYHEVIERLPYLPSVALVVVGDGPEKEHLRNRCRELNLTDRVLFIGFRVNAQRYYKAFDLFIMSSFSEGYNMAMLEAFSAGLPTVCSKLSIYSDVISDEDVEFFEWDNPSSFDSAVLNCFKNRGRLSLRSRSLFEKSFSLKSMATRHMELYRSLL